MNPPSTLSNTSGGVKPLNAHAPAFVPSSALNATAAEFTPPFRKEVFGAVVEFGPGAAVVSVKLPADCSSIQIIGLKPGQASIDGVTGLLVGAFGLTPGEFSVELFEVPKVDGLVATVKFNEFKAAQTIANQAKLVLTHSKFWEKTGRMAFIEYRVKNVDSDVFPGHVSQLLTPSGRRIKCISAKESEYEKGRGLQSFSLNNLDIDADSAWLNNTLVNAGYPAPKKVKIREVNRDGPVDDDECFRVVEAILKSIGPLESFHVGESVDGARKIVTATFCNREDAVKAVKTFRSKDDCPPGFDSKNLTIEPVVSMKVNIPNKIATALDRQLQAMRVELQKGDRDMLKIINDTNKSHWVVRFSDTGDDALAVVSKTKARIEKLLAGAVVSDSGVALWHPWFAAADDAGNYLNWLSLHTNVLRTVGGMSIAEALVILKPVFGDKIRLSTTDGSAKIKLCASAADLRKARLLLNPGTHSTAKNCVICWGPPSSFKDTISLPCGHKYCRECFNMQFKQQDRFNIPLICAGICSDNTECKYLFEIKLLREELSADMFEAVMNMCLDKHIRSHPDEFMYCPTIDCPTIYRPIPRSQQAANQGTSVTCTTCLVSICTSCRALHTGLTCREYIDATDGQDALNQYKAQAANRTKDCPSCHVPVEKLPEGCNHMLCAGCGTHFCWLCLHVSPNMADAYAHLNAVHGGNGLQVLPIDQILDPDALDDAFRLHNQNGLMVELNVAAPRNMVHGGFPAHAPVPDRRLANIIALGLDGW
ncbi:hypothetical protein DL98DRAFT_576534 [Cadophora sp. DSE1049]|nr:hypothetical protein DL98DRAFT_576534 [Cadophora sp. DSE1049]